MKTGACEQPVETPAGGWPLKSSLVPPGLGGQPCWLVTPSTAPGASEARVGMTAARIPPAITYLSGQMSFLRGWLSLAPGTAPAGGSGAALADGRLALADTEGNAFPRPRLLGEYFFLRLWHSHAVLPHAGPSRTLLLISHMGTSFFKKIFAAKERGNLEELLFSLCVCVHSSTVKTNVAFLLLLCYTLIKSQLWIASISPSQPQEAGLLALMSGIQSRAPSLFLGRLPLPLSTCPSLRKFFLIWIPR